MTRNSDPGGAGETSELAAVAASPGGGIWAVGSLARKGGRRQALAERWNGRSWVTAPVPEPAGRGVQAALAGISTAQGGLWAAGSFTTPGATRPLAERWDGRSWQIAAVPGSAAAKGSLAAVAADGRGQVWAVGAAGPASLVVRRAGGSWQRTPAGAAGAPPAAGSAGQASALAARLGTPVEVTGERTDWTRVFAEPQGGFAATVSMEPRQMRRPDGVWVAVNTRLSKHGKKVRPAATPADLTLSDGGTDPLYTLTSDAGTLSVSWPYGSLPVPVLSGSTAVYDDVLPGVNLLVTATPDGVDTLLEVTSADAAANPDLASISFPVASSGLTLSADDSGDLTVTDGSGDTLYTAPAPQMWDSSGQGVEVGPPPAPGDLPGNSPEPGDQRAVVGVSVAPGSMTLTPAASVLSGPSVTYPVFIDPNWDVNEGIAGTTWSDVEDWYASGSGGSATPEKDWMPTSSAGGIRSGVACDNSVSGVCTSGSPYEIYRSFLNFPVPSALNGAAFADAELEVNETWAWSCSATNSNVSWVTMYDTAGSSGNNNATTSTTAWPGPAAGDYLSHDQNGFGWLACPEQYIFLPAKQASTFALNNAWSTLTVRLSATATDESNFNPYSWKRFAVDTMTLDLFWRDSPGTPWNYGTEGAFSASTGTTMNYDCSTSSSNPDYVSSNQMTWRARISDADGVNGGNLGGYFYWVDTTTGATGTLNADADSAGGLASGSIFTGSRTGTPGDEYKWQAYGETEPIQFDPVGNPVSPLPGPASPWCYVKINNQGTGVQRGPANAPTVTFSNYTPGEPVGTQGTFTFADGQADAGTTNDVVGFYYGIDDPRPSQYVQATTVGSSSSSAAITLAPYSTAEEDLYVQAVDRAGNVGPVYGPLRIQAAATDNIATLGFWKLNGNGNDSATITGTSGGSMTLSSSGSSWGCPGSAATTPAGYSCSLALNGTAGYAATSVPMVGNNGSFSVSAWLYPSSCGSSPCTALSQDGSSVSGFRLGYQGSGTAGGTSCPCWLFAIPQSDSSSASWYTAALHTSAATGKWTQLTGVFNAAHGQLQLYVNGGDGTGVDDGLVAATASASPWASAATGPLRVGADWSSANSGNGTGDFFSGSVSDACAFYGVLQSGDVKNLYDNASADGCAALYSTYP